jgi:phosphoribulokinase
MKKRGYTKEQVLKQIESRKEDYYKFVYPQRNISDIVINFFTDSKEIDIENEINIYLRILINKKYDLTEVLNVFSKNNIDFEFKSTDIFNEIKFFKYEECDIIDCSLKSYYDYVMFFILSLQQKL